MSFSIALSSGVTDLSADGHERKMQKYSIFVQAVTNSRNKKINVAYVFFLILALSYTTVAAMCFLPNFAPRRI